MTMIETRPAPAAIEPLQPSLFGGGVPAVTALPVLPRRIELAHGAWVEHVPEWLAGEVALYEHLVATTAWHAHRRPMYDRMVDVPRLTATLPADGPGHPVLDDAAAALAQRYGSPFDRIGLAWYRDGRDSVAPHGDQVARTMATTTMATVSLGAPRRFVLTPAASPSDAPGQTGPVRFDLGHGDLLVMGGTIQRTWRHGVPKTTRPVGPRLCVMFRPPWLE